MLLQEVAVRVGALDGAEGSRRGEQDLDLMLLDDPPENAGVRRSDRLALEQDRRASGDQRRIDDVGMPDHPADVGCRPVDVTRLDIIDVRHRPLQRHRVPAIVADNAFRLAGGTRGVEDIERISRLYRHRRQLLYPVMRLVPFEITPCHQIGCQRLALVDDAIVGLVARQLDGLVEKRLVRNDPVRLVTA